MSVAVVPETANQNEAMTYAGLPLQPTLFRILVRMPEKVEQTQGGVYMPQQTVERDHTASIIGRVVALGPDAYDDEKKFPSGPACHLGDWVLFRSYAGTPFVWEKDGADYRVINDDSVEAVVFAPQEIRKP